MFLHSSFSIQNRSPPSRWWSLCRRRRRRRQFLFVRLVNMQLLKFSSCLKVNRDGRAV